MNLPVDVIARILETSGMGSLPTSSTFRCPYWLVLCLKGEEYKVRHMGSLTFDVISLLGIVYWRHLWRMDMRMEMGNGHENGMELRYENGSHSFINIIYFYNEKWQEAGGSSAWQSSNLGEGMVGAMKGVRGIWPSGKETAEADRCCLRICCNSVIGHRPRGKLSAVNADGSMRCMSEEAVLELRKSSTCSYKVLSGADP